MDTTDPEITFDKDGICNHCHRFDRRWRTEVLSGECGQAAIDQLVHQIKSQGTHREYDCVIGLSGGVDSTFVAYLVRRWGLRPLAVHLDNGWNSELAVANIERAVSRLGIDLHTHVIDWEEFRDLHVAFLKASVANSEIPTDHAILAILYETAARYGIRYIIGGGNIATEGVMPSSWMYDYTDLRHLKDIHRRFGRVPLRTFPTFSLSRFAYWTFVKGIRTIAILNCTDYVKSKAIEILNHELGWRNYGGKHYESVYTKWFQAYMLPVKFGIDKRLAHYSSMILSGQLPRSEALDELSRPPYDPDTIQEETSFVLKKLGLGQSEFDEIMGQPVRTYRDYRSNARLLRGMPRIMRFVKRVATQRKNVAA
jgi:N-acetyl sugar amidotransferase